MVRLRHGIVAVLCLFASSWWVAAAQAVETKQIATGFAQPLQFVDDPLPGGNRRFVVEKTGTVKIVQGGNVSPTPFLDLSSIVTTDVNEGGLLGIAFHPDFQNNRYLFVNYTVKNKRGDLFTIIRRLRVSATNPDKVIVGNIRNERVLRIKQPRSNHNGGQLLFGPKDGLLYISSGDGGGGGDPDNYAQKRNNLFGKILRINPTLNASRAGYTIPAGNPYSKSKRLRKEIFHYGLRNPWRSSFDRATGDMYIGDVGQNAFEEIDRVVHGQKGLNFGWRRLEGRACYNPTQSCRVNPKGKKIKKLKGPIIAYAHSEGRSVTGGYLYRGSAIPALRGKYVFGDFTNGVIWAATNQNGKWSKEVLLSTSFRIASFGEDNDGELFVVDLVGGGVHKIIPA